MDNSSARGIVKLTIAAAANNAKDVGEKATNGDWNSAIGINQAPISIYVLFKRADGRIRAYNEVSARGPIFWGNWHAQYPWVVNTTQKDGKGGSPKSTEVDHKC